MFRRFKVREHERGLLFRDREFKDVLRPGVHWSGRPAVQGARRRRVGARRLARPQGPGRDRPLGRAAPTRRRSLDLKDHERAVVWVDGRLEAVLKPGLYALWTVFHDVRVEIVRRARGALRARRPRGDRSGCGPALLLETSTIEAGHAGLLFQDGRHEATLAPGPHAFWKGVVPPASRTSTCASRSADVAGQEIMTADKVTLRLNAVVTYKVADPLRPSPRSQDYRQALYREAQLALRAVVGTRELDALLGGQGRGRPRAGRRAAARVGRVRRRGRLARHPRRDPAGRDEGPHEQGHRGPEGGRGRPHHAPRGDGGHALAGQHGAASSSQNPTLMRLRELEVLEKVAEKANLTVVLGEGGLADRVVKMV